MCGTAVARGLWQEPVQLSSEAEGRAEGLECAGPWRLRALRSRSRCRSWCGTGPGAAGCPQAPSPGARLPFLRAFLCLWSSAVELDALRQLPVMVFVCRGKKKLEKGPREGVGLRGAPREEQPCRPCCERFPCAKKCLVVVVPTQVRVPLGRWDKHKETD